MHFLPPQWRHEVRPVPLAVGSLLLLTAFFLVLESWSTLGAADAPTLSSHSVLSVAAVAAMKGSTAFYPRVLFPNAWGHPRAQDPDGPLAIVVADVFLVGKCLGVSSHLDQDPSYRYSLRNMSIRFENPSAISSRYNKPLRLQDVRENDGWETSSSGWLCLPELADVDAVEVSVIIDSTKVHEKFTAFRDWARVEDFAARSDGVIRQIRGFAASGAALSLELSSTASRCPIGGGGLAIMTLLSERDIHIAPAWIDHWRALGASQFYLYWNGDPTRLRSAAAIVTLTAVAGQPDVTLIAWPLPYRTRTPPSVTPKTERHCAQTVAISHALSRFGHCHDWLAHMDLDEWLLPGPAVTSSGASNSMKKASAARKLRGDELLVRGAPASGAVSGERTASGSMVGRLPLEASLFAVLPQPAPTPAPSLLPGYSPKQPPAPFTQSIPPKDRWTGSRWLQHSFLDWLEASCLKRACILTPHWGTVKFRDGSTKWSAAIASQASLTAVANATLPTPLPPLARNAAETATGAAAGSAQAVEVPPILSRDMAAATLLRDGAPVPGKRFKVIYGLRGARTTSDPHGDLRQRLVRHPGVHQSRELYDYVVPTDTWLFAHVLNLGVSHAHVSVTQWEIDKEVKAMVAAAASKPSKGSSDKRVVVEDVGLRTALKSAGVAITMAPADAAEPKAAQA